MADMSADVLKNNLTNSAKGYLWELVFSNVIGGGDGDALRVRCQSTSLPGRSVGTIPIPFKGTAGIVVPGKLQMSHSWTCGFLESTEDQKTFDAVHAWHQAIVHERLGTGGPDPAIKADIFIRLLDQAGSVWRTIKLIGCFPADVAEVSLSYDDNSNITLSVTWSYDRWEEVS